MESKQYSEEIDFQKYWLVLKRRWLPATGIFGIFVVLGGISASLEKPTYQAEGKLLFKLEHSSDLIGLKNDVGELVPIGEKTNPLSTEAQILGSYTIAQKTVNALGLKDPTGKLLDPNVVSGGLQVKPIAGTDILQINYQANSPQVAAAVVNKVMDIYIENNIQNNQAKARNARIFISKQLPEVEATVRQADAYLRKFKEENSVVSLTEEASASVRIVSELDSQIAQTQARLADASARATALRNRLGINSEAAVAVSSLSQSRGVQQVLTELQKVQTKLAAERARFLETAPQVSTLRNEEAGLNAVLQGRVSQVLGGQGSPSPAQDLQVGELKQTLTADLVKAEAERSGLAKQLTVIYNTQAAYKKRSNVMPRLEQNEREMERRVKASQLTYETLLNKLQEAQVAENQDVGNARVVSTALVPKKKAGPSKMKYLTGGGAVGLLLGIATAFLLDVIDKSVKTIKEARRLFGYTLLGVIPAYGKPGKNSRSVRDSERIVPGIIARDMPCSPIGEAYQMLQANLKFLSSDKQLKAIVVTSSVPKEGKSEVSANLAAAMAHVGRRVLLVDADMRHPSQHHIWELTNSMGLSNVLVGDAEFNTVVQEVMPRLDVLPSGVIPPNPVALLDSKRMASLVETFSNNYDCVIFDTPPLAGFADAPILGKMADGILLVVRPGVVDSASANAGKDFLTRSGQNVLGLVANGVIIKNEPDSYFYYTKEQYKERDAASKGSVTSSAGRYTSRS